MAQHRNHVHGIIPANTGKIVCGRVPDRVYQDHPREYGENAALGHSLTGN